MLGLDLASRAAPIGAPSAGRLHVVTLSKRVDSLVDHQLARWEAASRPPKPQPCVAIANLPGAGGEEVGRLVAGELGYGLFAREIVDEIARRRGVHQELVRGLDERVTNVIDRYVTSFFRERSFDENEYLREVVRAVTTLGRRGMAVVVGRGAAFILSPDVALRVLVTAPVDARIERYAKLQQLERTRAAAALAQEDVRRIEFVRHHFGVQIGDPLWYDVVVNTGVLGIETAAHVVADVYRRRFPEAQGES
jgi:cytidylate kinase